MDVVKQNIKGEDKEFLKKEYEIAVDTYRTQIITAVQIVSGFVALAVTVVGIGIGYKKSWLFLAAALISIVIFFVIKSTERVTRPFLLRAIEIENSIGSKGNSIVSFWFLFFYKEKGYKKILEAISEGTNIKRYKKLNELKSRLNNSIYVILLMLTILILIFLSYYLQTLESWTFF